jgi:hypothetical protein
MINRSLSNIDASGRESRPTLYMNLASLCHLLIQSTKNERESGGFTDSLRHLTAVTASQHTTECHQSTREYTSTSRSFREE